MLDSTTNCTSIQYIHAWRSKNSADEYTNENNRANSIHKRGPRAPSILVSYNLISAKNI